MTTEWLFKKSGQPGAEDSQRQRLSIQKPSEGTQLQSPFNVPHSTGNMQNMSKLEERALEVENKSHQDFLFAHLAILHQAPQSLKENLHSTYNLLLGQSLFQLIPSAKVPQAEGQLLMTISPKPEPKWSPRPKRQHSSTDAQGDTSIDEDFPVASQEGPSSSKRERNADWSSSLKPSHMDAFS